MLESANPFVLTTISAALLASSHVFYRDALIRLSPETTTILANASVGVFALAFYALAGASGPVRLQGALYYALAGVCANFLTRYISYNAVVHIGMSRTQVMSQVRPIFSTLIAVVVLGERPAAPVVLGTCAIICGGALLVRERDPAGGRIALAYYLLPVLGGFTFALAPTLRKLAFEHLPAVSLGLVISSAAGVAVQLAASPLLRRKSVAPSQWDRRSLVAIASGGLVNMLAAVCFWVALKQDQVAHVVPLRRTSVLFVLLFSWIFYRNLERVTPRVVAGGVLSAAGAFLIVLGH